METYEVGWQVTSPKHNMLLQQGKNNCNKHSYLKRGREKNEMQVHDKHWSI